MATKKLSYFVENENGACRLCTEPDGEEILVQCDECDRWIHLACAKLTVAPSAKEEWLCIKCKAINDQIQEKEKTVNLEATRQSKKIALANLPYFVGKPKDWPRFMKAFEESTKEAGFSQLENLNRLQRFWKGEAERSVRALLLDPMNVPAILTRLEEQVGRPDLVYQEMLKEVLKIKIDGQFKIPELSDALNNLVTNVKAN
uniref:PHD-type domain-containing protein n=1 Tax=Anopheles funestus TaxID=62324 RepID=A0A182S028_ANOFN